MVIKNRDPINGVTSKIGSTKRAVGSSDLGSAQPRSENLLEVEIRGGSYGLIRFDKAIGFIMSDKKKKSIDILITRPYHGCLKSSEN